MDIEGPLTTPISIDSSLSEYELTGLKSDTKYIVIIRLYNEAGVAEEKIHIKTNKINGNEVFFSFDVKL